MNAIFNNLIESELMHRVGWTLLHSIWLLALLGILTVAAMNLLKRTSAQARYACGYLGLILMAVAPLAMFAISPVKETDRPEAAPVVSLISETPVVGPEVTLPLPRESVSVPTNSELALPAKATAQDSPIVSSTPPAAGRGSASSIWSMAAPWIGLAWLVGIVLLSIWRAGGWWTARRMQSIGSTPIPGQLTNTCEQLRKLLKVSTPVRVLQSSLVQVPSVFGWLKPTILLPMHVLESLTGAQLRMVLAHELAHIRRNDYLANLVQTCIETLLFFHPAVWWVSRRIRAERENCCDDLAVQYCGQSSELASALVVVEEGRCAPLPSPALAATGGDTHKRVRRLLGIPSRGRDRVGLSAFSILFGVSLLAFIGIAVAEPDGEKDQATKPKKAGAENAADPNNALYNALYDVLMTRYGKDGKSHAGNGSTPTILPLSQFPFGDKTYKKVNAALDAFAALTQPEIEAYSDVQRAILQRHLWKVYDSSHPEYSRFSTGKRAIIRGHADRRAAIRPKIASLVQRLALTRDQILALPNTLAATIESSGSAQHYDPKDHFKSFLPADLNSKKSAWVCMGNKEGGESIPADVHSEKFNWRSAFLAFMRAPGGREETIKSIEKFNREEVLPVGTQFALLEQAFLVSDEGELVLSPMVVSVSLRAYLGEDPKKKYGKVVAAQSVAEFLMQPRQLMRGDAAMRALAPESFRYEIGEVGCLSGGVVDPFESSESHHLRPRLKQCSHCHGWSQVANRSGIHTARPGFLMEGNPEAISKATSARKQEDKTWETLREFWKVDSPKSGE